MNNSYQDFYMNRIYMSLIWITFALSGWVLMEPAPFDLLVILLFIIGCFAIYLRYKPSFILPLILVWLFLLSNLFSMFFMDSFSTSLHYFLITVYLVIFWLLVVGLLNTAPSRVSSAMLSGYVVAGASSALIGILAYYQLIPYSESFLLFDRIKGMFQDPNVFGPFLVPIAMLSILYIESSSSKKGVLLWGSIFTLTSAAVFLSFSRAAWINYLVSFCVLLFLWILLSKNQQILIKRALYLALITFIFLVGIVVVLNSPAIHSMFEARLGLQGYDEDRFSTQLNVLESIIQRPLGIGPGQSDSITGYSPHSLYVRVLGENGILGFGIFILFLLVTWIRSIYLAFYEKTPIALFCTACLLGIFVNSLVIDTLHWRHFWLLLAIPWMPLMNKKTKVS